MCAVDTRVQIPFLPQQSVSEQILSARNSLNWKLDGNLKAVTAWDGLEARIKLSDLSS